VNVRLLAVSFLSLWCGATLLFAELRVVNRRSLTERLCPYSPRRGDPRARAAVHSVRELVEPLARAAGARAARLFGVAEELQTRLDRCHADVDVTGFRMRQLGWSVAAFGAGSIAALGLGAAPAPGALLVLGTPALAFLVVEQRLAAQSARWQQRLQLELPIVAEQLGMLLGAGYSLGGAIARIADRGHGACSRDLARVCSRVRQGVSDVDALREWAHVAGVAPVDRLVGVLALNREAGDLGRLIAEEARAVRREAQRELVEAIERRGQQVWIPVTVATLVPGVIFLAVPFLDAMRVFAGS
jgi:Flp pilus assembly protein TadB